MRASPERRQKKQTDGSKPSRRSWGRVLGAETYVLEEVLQGRLRRQVYIKSRTLRV